MIAGGIGHTFSYLIGDFFTANLLAAIMAVIELLVIAWIQSAVYGDDAGLGHRQGHAQRFSWRPAS